MEVLNTSINHTTVVLPDLGLRIASGESIKVPLERLVGSEDFIKALSRRVLGVRFAAGEAVNNPLFAVRIKESLALGRTGTSGVKKFEFQETQFGVATKRVSSIEVERAGILRQEPDSRALKEEIRETIVRSEPVVVLVSRDLDLLPVLSQNSEELLQQYLLQAVYVAI